MKPFVLKIIVTPTSSYYTPFHNANALLERSTERVIASIGFGDEAIRPTQTVGGKLRKLVHPVDCINK